MILSDHISKAVHIQMNVRGVNIDKQKDEGSELVDLNATRGLEIEYANGETVCKGFWCPKSFDSRDVSTKGYK